MRPTHLTAEGFTAFRDQVDVDFERAEFFALVGPTGSGKSSVLDAICFALYGSVPRYTDDRLVAPAITQGANEARVCLTFEIDGQEYVATRVVRRTTSGGATTREARLERGSEVLAGNAKELTEAITKLIGLSFHHFTRCVALPQGEFATFLHDKPSDRQDLVVKLLDLGIYERMQRRARELAATGKNEIALAQQRLTELQDCTAEAESISRVELEDVRDLRVELKAAAPKIDQLVRDAAEARGQADAADLVVTALAKVKVPKAVAALADRRIAALEQHQAADHERERREREVTKAAKSVEGLPDPGALEALLDAHDELSGLRSELKKLDAKSAEAQKTLVAARDESAKAEHAVMHAEAEHEAALEGRAAAALAETLVAGEPCPVCLQVVEHPPKTRAGAESKTKKSLDQARKSQASARTRHDAASKQQTELASETQNAAKRVAALEKKVSTSGTRKQVEGQLVRVQRSRAEYDAAHKAQRAAAADERKVRAAVTELDSRLADARTEFQDQRDPLVGAGLAVPATSPNLVADWEILATWSASELPSQRKVKDAAAARAVEQAAGATEALRHLLKLAADRGLELPKGQQPSLEILREVAAEAEGDRKHELDRLAKGRKESAKLEKGIASTRVEVEIAEELSRLLKSNNFEQWLVNEALERLVEGASDTLEALSNKQYALAVNDKNEFEVIDHRNADERRAAKTLSGGETFQAALALSLALAKQLSDLAAQGAAKLDAIFLDEGFGTLDPDSLDTVAATLETLGGDGRMVGIITHVRELAERVPTRFEVTKGPRTSTITRVDT